MTGDREGKVSRAFVTLSGGLAHGDDVLDLLNNLTAVCARLLDVDSAGLLLADHFGVLRVMAASSERTRQLDAFQLQRAEGPCRDCYLEGAPVIIPDLEQAADRWPQFAPAARQAGFHSVHAVPMRLRGNTLGALGLFGTARGQLNEADLSLAQALADVASVAVLQNTEDIDEAAASQRLQTALSSRVVLEQAKGVIAQQSGLDMTQALDVLRKYSRDQDLRLTFVARSVVSSCATKT